MYYDMGTTYRSVSKTKQVSEMDPVHEKQNVVKTAFQVTPEEMELERK